MVWSTGESFEADVETEEMPPADADWEISLI